MAKTQIPDTRPLLIEIGPQYPSLLAAAKRIAQAAGWTRLSRVLDPLMVEVREGRLPVYRLRAPRGWSKEDGDFADVDFVEYEDGSVHQIEAIVPRGVV